METIRMKLADMKKAAKNVRMHTEKQLQEYERSIRMFGQIRPIVVDGVENLTVLNEFIEDLRDDLDIPGFDEEILKQMVSEAEVVTEKICEYGTLDENEIQELKKLGERKNSAYENESLGDREVRTAPGASRSIQEPVTPEEKYPTENPNSVMSEPEGRFVICPDCGRKIWL